MKQRSKAPRSDNVDGGVRVVERVARLLEALSKQESISLKELSISCELAISTTARLLESMQRYGLVEREPVSKEYRLGRTLFRIVSSSKPRQDVVSVAHPVLQELVKKTAEDALLAELQGTVAVFIDHVEGPHLLKIVNIISHPEPLYYGAFRKVLLAFQEDEWVTRYLEGITFERLTKSTIGNRTELWREIKKIRKQCYATSFGESLPEAAGIAAPVFDFTGRIRACVHLVGPISRINARTVRDYLPEVMRAANEISVAIGGRKSFDDFGNEEGISTRRRNTDKKT